MEEPDNQGYLNDGYLDRLKELTEVLNAGDNERANRLIGELTTLRESALFQELGKLTREIHNSLNAFSDDHRVVELAEEDIPDAKERLRFIITRTDQAAHSTMSSAESAMNVVDELRDKGNDIKQRWAQFRNREISKTNFLSLSDDMDRFLSSLDEHSDQVKAIMTDIMMAQDYQDLTGQMIKQVISMVQEVEEKMVRLVAISGATLQGKKNLKSDGAKAHGPQLPTADKQEVATNQDEVDDLLASLGF